LLIPHIGKRSVRGDSNFLLYLDIARVFASKGDFVHLLVDGNIQKGDLPEVEGVFYIVTPELRGLSYYNKMALLPQRVVEECSRRSGWRCIDAVLTSRPGIVASVKLALSAVDDAFIPVIYLEPGADDRLPRPHGGEDYRRLMAHAWQAADMCVALTQREKEVILQNLRRYISGSEIQVFMERVVVSPVGVPLDSVDAVRGVAKHPKMTLFFGARAKEVKNIDLVVKTYDRLFKVGKDIRIVVATPTHGRKVVELIGKQVLEANTAIEICSGLSRQEYLKKAAEAHVFLAMSRTEGFPVGFWEQMYLGLIGVFPRKPWAVGQLPEEYPFFFDTEEEAFALLSWIIDHYDEAKAKVAFMEPLIREKYGHDTVWTELRARVLPLCQGHQYCIGPTFRELVDDAISAIGDNEFDFNELLAYMSAQSKRMPAGNFARAEDQKYPGNYDIYRYLVELGLNVRVKGEGNIILFSREPCQTKIT